MVYTMRFIALLPILLYSKQFTVAFSPHNVPPYPSTRKSSYSFSSRPPRSTNACLNAAESILSDTDIMCIMNAADLCSFYDECDIEEREALLNRFEEQTEILAERMAIMTSLTAHLRSGDHMHLEEFETSKLKQDILQFVEDESTRSAIPSP